MNILKLIHQSSAWQRVLIGMIAGIIVGLYFGKQVSALSYLGIIFLNLIKMVTIPLIFFTIIYGITSIDSSGGLYRISIKAIATFILTAFMAVCVGLITAKLLQPGHNVDLSILINNAPPNSQAQSLIDILIGIIPTNVVASLAEGHILQVIVFSFFVGVTLHTKRDSCQDLIKICHQISKLLFQMIETIMRIAPIGVFGYIAAIVGNEGITILFTMAKLVLAIFVGCIIQYILFGVMILLWGKMSPMPFYRKMLEPQLLAFSTSSSKATLVPLMKVAESRLGISTQNSKFLLPLSAALNMDGGAIYQSICAVFFSQALGIHLSWADYGTLIIMCTIASIGGAGIPGGVLLFLGMVLQSVGIPIDGVLIVASVDRILDMVTTMINVTGDACVTLLIDRSENTLDKKIYDS
ncbi:Dicarboxylate/amino acid:cation symporter [Candidatus Trichorickettsia mobilis]|uniref:Dicarboxylate/amino acid:cation symporter n=1 Tax=Candidatus Trichorickettsia mobilis TaxID=1346319 RepID=A0ABZ0UR37_9RICK|nr:dicarboxylate/amino acid:cation symporter [Candidatus Trichorickettsia mobilis]WPY00495.1 Dicarboxylate/amino acid:cation symporter [Candidatus Trichorickettsia mobilis]